MDGRKELTLVKMTSSETQIQDIWKEIIIKESIKNMTIILDKVIHEQTQTRQIIKEELTNLWNVSEIPTFKIILEKLTSLEEERVKNKQIIKEDNDTQTSEIVPINAWKRSKEPIMVDISKMKPNIPEPVGKVLDGLSLLHKKGKF